MLHKLLLSIHPIKMAIITGSLLLSFVLIVLNNSGVFPLALGDFIFFSGIIVLFALYRPGWAFLFFISTLPFEIVNIAPVEMTIMLRPYQWIGILTITAVAIRYAGRRLSFALPKINRYDTALLLVWLGSILSIFGAPDRNVSLKQSLIFFSYIVLYALVRIFVRTVSDVKNSIALFIGSGIIVSVYALWQNMRFANGGSAFEVMVGRPNSVFTEPDWMGAFLVVCIGAVYAILACVQPFKEQEGSLQKQGYWKVPFTGIFFRTSSFSLYVLLILFFVALIISVSRSAWLSVAVITFATVLLVSIKEKLSEKERFQWKEGVLYATGIALACIASILIVSVFHLTSFQLLNRAQSTASGLQRITVACDHDVALPENIITTDELIRYGCRHIALENIQNAQAEGNVIKELYRDDPNVSIRRDIYAKTLSIVREHFVTGIGFGSSRFFLGSDERGAGLNASNMFLEVWLGSGLIGLIAFVFVWVSIGMVSIRRLLIAQKNKDLTALYVFIFLSWIGLTIFNLFNAGLFLGFFWAWLAVAVSFVHKKINI